MDFNTNRVEYIRDLIENKKPFCVIDDSGRTWLDMMVPDATSDFALKFLAKFNLTPFNMAKPTFGTIGNPVGIIMVSIPYDKILGIIEMDISESMMNKFREEYPEAYEFWSKGNSVEAALPTLNNNLKSEKVKAWEAANKDKLDQINRTSAIPTGVEEGYRFH